jgi:flavin reductase (DIM6/NTAB) family NADH-FMN oxidoreductase RutF
MFYRPGLDPHGLAHNPFKALIAPRPIGWIATLDTAGRANLAPYSFFNAIADDPPLVMYSNTGAKIADGSRKDTLANIRATGEFVHHVVPFALHKQMNQTSGPWAADADEFEIAGLAKASSRIVAPPRIADAPAALECRVWRIIDLPGPDNHMVIGEVVGVHIDERFVVDGKVDVTLYRPVARLGYRDYTAVDSLFQMTRPRAD